MFSFLRLRNLKRFSWTLVLWVDGFPVENKYISMEKFSLGSHLYAPKSIPPWILKITRHGIAPFYCPRHPLHSKIIKSHNWLCLGPIWICCYNMLHWNKKVRCPEYWVFKKIFKITVKNCTTGLTFAVTREMFGHWQWHTMSGHDHTSWACIHLTALGEYDSDPTFPARPDHIWASLPEHSESHLRIAEHVSSCSMSGRDSFGQTSLTFTSSRLNPRWRAVVEMGLAERIYLEPPVG